MEKINLKTATLKELMVFSGCFPGLGEETINSIDFFIDINFLEDDDTYYNEQFRKLKDIIGEEKAQIYLNNLPVFYKFLRKLHIPFRIWDK